MFFPLYRGTCAHPLPEITGYILSRDAHIIKVTQKTDQGRPTILDMFGGDPFIPWCLVAIELLNRLLYLFCGEGFS